MRSTLPPRKTKLIATLGPACDRAETLEAMILAGMNVARLNMSHGTPDEHRTRLELLRRVSEQLGAKVATMLDTRGIEIRTGFVEGECVQLARGAPFALYLDDRIGDEAGVSVSQRRLGGDVSVGAPVLIDDGLIELRVEGVAEDRIDCLVERGGRLRSRKGVNLPSTRLSPGHTVSEDVHDLVFAAENDVDYIAASFVQSAEDVQAIRACLVDRGVDIPIIAKIENRAGVESLDEIVEAANGTMVARGDLGVELPVAEVPATQKKIIRATVTSGKPVITATQMLDSMERNPVPSRAEVSDVANAILDGTSAVMLSGETAIGEYPVEAVRTMASIALQAESDLREYGYLQKILPHPSHVVTEAVSQAAITMANHLDADAIVIDGPQVDAGMLQRQQCGSRAELDFAAHHRHDFALLFGNEPAEHLVIEIADLAPDTSGGNRIRQLFDGANAGFTGQEMPAHILDVHPQRTEESDSCDRGAAVGFVGSAHI